MSCLNHPRHDEPEAPRHLDGLALWLAADRIPGPADAAALARWPDLSAFARHALQAAAANQPTVRTAVLNGRPVVRFDGTDDYLSAAGLDLTGGDGVTIFVVQRSLAGASNRLLDQGASPGTSPGISILDWSGGAPSALLLRGTLPPVLTFDPASQHCLGVDDGTALDVFPFTVAGWVYANAFLNNTRLCHKWDASGGILLYSNLGVLTAQYWKDTTNYVAAIPASGAMTTGAWLHIAFVVDAIGGSIYINGVEDAWGPWYGADGPPTATAVFQIGKSGSPYLDGMAESWGVWNKALSAAEVYALYNQGQGYRYADLPAALRTSLLSWWDLGTAAPGPQPDSVGARHLVHYGIADFTRTTGQQRQSCVLTGSASWLGNDVWRLLTARGHRLHGAALWLDGSLYLSGTQPYGLLPNDTAYLGAGAAAAQPLDGDVAEVVVYSRALDDEPRWQIERYLARKWGLSVGADAAPVPAVVAPATLPAAASYSDAPAATTPSLAADLLVNGALEAPYVAGLANGWTAHHAPTLAEENVIVHGGASSQKITADAGGNDGIYQNFASAAGTWYQIAGWAYCTGTNRGDVEFWDNGAFLTRAILTGGSAWTRLITTGRATSATTQARLTAANANNVAYFDDVSAQALTFASLLSLVRDVGRKTLRSTLPVTCAVGTQAGLAVCVDDVINPRYGLFAFLDRTGADYVTLATLMAGTWTQVFRTTTGVTYAAARNLRIVTNARLGKVAVLYESAAGVYTLIGGIQAIDLTGYGTQVCWFDPTGANTPGTLETKC